MTCLRLILGRKTVAWGDLRRREWSLKCRHWRSLEGKDSTGRHRMSWIGPRRYDPVP